MKQTAPLDAVVAHNLRATPEEFQIPDDLISAIMERIGVVASQIVNTPSAMPVAADWHPQLARNIA